MTKLSIILFSLATIASCGDNLKGNTDGGHGSDAGSGNNFPAAPALGAQIDRMARPAINTVLNHGFDTNAATAGAAKDAYNQDGSPGGWMQYAPAFAGALAILDGLDTGLSCVNGACTPAPAQAKGAGCGNQVVYNGQLGGDQGGTPTATSYGTLAVILTDDELWLDTTKTKCDLGPDGDHQNYLGVELNALSNGAIPNTCGGRDPLNDVIDTSYSALSVGFSAFNTSTFKVAVKDGVDPHTDVSDTDFPFLGPPHS